LKVEAIRTIQNIPTYAPSGAYLGTLARERRRDALRGLGYLGQASSAAAMSVTQAIAQANPSHKSPDDTTMSSAVTGLQLTPGYNTPSECAQAGKGVGKTAVVETAVGAATMKVAAATGPAAPFVAVAGAIVSLIGAITGHHAQAVANEQTILCQAVPSTNQALASVVSAVQGGTLSPSDGISALQQIQSAFNSAVQPITKSCNEACGLSKELDAIVIYLSAQFQAMPPSSVPNVLASVSGGTFAGIPTWVLIAGIAAVVLFL
jgi:hypothetical protein